MRIECLDVDGYRGLRGTFELGNGLTVVTGPNESGKSTLHEALTVALFGFSPSDRRAVQGRSPRDRRRPWNGESFGLLAHAIAPDGRHLRLKWDLDDDAVTVRDALTGEKLLDEHPQQRRDYTVGRTFFGLDREEHEQLSCLFQEGLAPVKASEDLRQALQRAVESTSGDERGVEGADERLQAVLRQLGVQTHHYGTLKTGRLVSLEGSLGDARSTLELAQAQRGELTAVVAEQATCATAAQELDLRIEAVQQSRLRFAAERAREDDNGLEEDGAEGSIAEQTRPALPRDLPGRVASVAERWRLSAAAATDAAAAADGASSAAAPRQEELRLLESEIDFLPDRSLLDLTHESEVRGLVAELDGLPRAPDPPSEPDARNAVLARFRVCEDERAAADGEPGPHVVGRRPIVVALGGGLTLAGIAGGVLISGLLWILAVLGVVLVLVAGWPRRASTSRTEETFEGTPLPELRRRAGEEDRAWMAFDAAAAEHRRAAGAVEAREVGLRAELREQLGEGSSGDLRTVAETYLASCGEQRRRETLEGRALSLRAVIRETLEPVQALRTATEVHDEDRLELDRLLARADLSGDDREASLAAFRELERRDDDARDAAKRLAAAAARREQLLAGRTPAAVHKEAVDAAAKLSAHERAFGRLNSLPGADIDAMRSQRDELLAKRASLATRREALEEQLLDFGDIESRIDRLSREIGALALKRDAVRIARDELRNAATAAHRRVAPHLNAALAKRMPIVTRGRYRTALVEDDLSINVELSGSGRIVSVEELSRGTRDQIALVQRLELARLLDPSGGGSPLLLDDCFAHTDPLRLPLAIGLLVEVAAKRQVMLFTDDPAVVERALEADHTAQLIELPDPITTNPS